MMTGFQKSWLPLMLVAVLSLGFATAAWAGPKGMGGGCCRWRWPRHGHGPWYGHGSPGCGMGHGMKGMQLTPEQAAKAFDLRHKFMNDTAELRKQMWVKQAELRELWQAKEPDKAKITAKQKEINAVRDQLQEKGTAFKLEMRKEFPNMGGGKGPGAGCPMMEAAARAPAVAGPMAPPAPEGAKQ